MTSRLLISIVVLWSSALIPGRATALDGAPLPQDPLAELLRKQREIAFIGERFHTEVSSDPEREDVVARQRIRHNPPSDYSIDFLDLPEEREFHVLVKGEKLYEWGERGRVYAGLNLGLDYLFMVAYAGAIGLGCALVADRLAGGNSLLSLVGRALAWGQFGAALLDAIENYALIRLLLGSEGAVWPALAKWCAFFKFAIVALGLAYVAIGAVVITIKKNKLRRLSNVR